MKKGMKQIGILLLAVLLTFNGTIGYVAAAEEAEKVESTASLFRLDEVSLDGDDTVFSQNMQHSLDYLKTVDVEKFLYNFYITYRQEPPTNAKASGWESNSCNLRGHYAGHFLSALAQAYASTGEEVYKERIDYFVSKLREFQLMCEGDAADFKTECEIIEDENGYSVNLSVNAADNPAEWGEGYLGAYPPDQFAILEMTEISKAGDSPVWAPYYTMHKIMAGLIDCYTYAENKEALDAATALADWCYDRLSVLDEATLTDMWEYGSGAENGGIADAIMQLYWITGDEKYIQTASLFDRKSIFNGLATGEDHVKNRHCNSLVPQIKGAIEQYKATGNSYYYNIVNTFWNTVIEDYIYSIGGVGTYEHFSATPDTQAKNINRRKDNWGGNCETCATYNMLKLTLELVEMNPDNAIYMDYYERALVNHIAASTGRNKNYETKGYLDVTYMQPLSPGEAKGYDTGGFSCCHGSGMENHVRYQEGVYVKSEDTLYVNLYMPTTVNWEEKNLEIKQETVFPSETSVLTVSGTGTANMKLRVPYWATDGFEVKVNGEILCTNPEPSSYFEVKGVKGGDKIEINMPYTIHLDKTPDKLVGREVASVMYGPIVMVIENSAQEWLTLDLAEDVQSKLKVEQYNTGEDGNRNSPKLIYKEYEFVPIYDIRNEAYHAYVKLKGEGIPIDQNALEKSADVDYSFCSGWETISAVNDGIVSETSLGKDVLHFGTWGNDDATEEWVKYLWEESVWIDTTGVFFFDNSNGGDGGVQVPESYTYEYRDKNGRWQLLVDPQGFGIEQDQYNKTTFEPVEATGLRITMVKKAAGVGIIEWKVSGKDQKDIEKVYWESSAKSDCSYCSSWESIEAINDGLVSKTSLGEEIIRFGTWGSSAAEEWVSYSWEEPVKISESDICFYDDSIGGPGGVLVPESYKYEYLDENGNWVEVSNPVGLSTDRDEYNRTTFEMVETTDFRVTMKKSGEAVGILEWKVGYTDTVKEEESVGLTERLGLGIWNIINQEPARNKYRKKRF